MSAEHKELAEVARELIREEGRAMILRKPGQTTGPDWDPIVGEPIDLPITAFQVNFSTTETDGTLVQLQDRMFLVEALEQRPTDDMTILDRGTQLQIVDVKAVEPGDTPILFKIQVRA